MDAVTRIEQALQTAIGRADVPGCPPRLAAAMRHAVFPRGARIRPRLCLAVAAACGDDEPPYPTPRPRPSSCCIARRWSTTTSPVSTTRPRDAERPSVHRAFGERLAVLAGDALIVLAFQTLARAPDAPQRLAAAADDHLPRGRHAVRHRRGPGLGVRAACRPRRLPARQDRCAVRRRHDGGRERRPARTPSPGACSANTWARLIRSPTTSATRSADPDELGKPIGRDAALGRPSAVLELGIGGAIAPARAPGRRRGRGSIPACPGAADAAQR